MADIKLFNINGKVKEYQSSTVTLEKELQTVIENNMETFFGVKVFLDLWVKVKEKWRDSASLLGNFGYKDET